MSRNSYVFDPRSGNWRQYVAPFATPAAAAGYAMAVGRIRESLTPDAPTVAYNTYRSRMRPLEDRPVPVKIGAPSEEHRKGSKRSFARRVKPGRLFAADKNVATFIWNNTTPYHTAFGHNPIPNAYTGSASENDGTYYLPCHIYDLTAAPNWQIGSAATTRPSDAVISPTVMYTPYTTIKADTTNGGQAWNVLTMGSACGNQAPDGTLQTTNKWHLKYLKKPIHGVYVFNTASTGDTVYSGNAASNLTASGAVATRPTVWTPPVGRKPLHRSTRVRLGMVGTYKCPITWDVSVVRFRREEDCPGFFSTATNGTGYSSVTATGDDVINTWQQFLLPYTHDTDVPADKSLVRSRIQFLYRKTYQTDARAPAEYDGNRGDPGLHCIHDTLTFDWNRIRSYAWRRNKMTAPNALERASMASGVTTSTGYSTNIADQNNLDTNVDWTGRIFLIIRARSPLVTGITKPASTGWQSVDGSSCNFGNIDYTPSYDISIENTFALDTSP